MSLCVFFKDPNEVKDYTVNWSGRLLAGETISTSTWVVPTGITEGDSSTSTTAATLWLSGGTSGTVYVFVNRITTSASRVYEVAFNVNCKNSTER